MLLGRAAEIEVLARVIGQARAGGSAALVIRGDAGIGKTGLLNEMISLADDFELIRVDGVESEVHLGYAALHRIVLPFIDRIGQLPPPQRAALESAFGSVLLDHRIASSSAWRHWPCWETSREPRP